MERIRASLSRSQGYLGRRPRAEAGKGLGSGATGPYGSLARELGPAGREQVPC